MAFAAVVLLVLGARGPVARWSRGRRARAADLQERLGLPRPLPGSVYGAPVAALLLGATTSLLLSPIAGIGVAVAAYVLLEGAPRRHLLRDRARLDLQIVEGLSGIANSMRAGLSLPRAIEQVAKDAPVPLSRELDRVLRDYERGKSIERALADAAPRFASRNYDLALEAFRVGMQRGGNIAQVFDKIAASIREIWRLEEKIRTATTASRSTARFMTLMPLGFLVLLFVMDSKGASLLFTDPVGMGILGVVALLNVMANLWLRRIAAADL
jgi:tight adherence protein B